MKKFLNIIFLSALLLLLVPGVSAQEGKRYSHAQVAREVIKKFKSMKSYQAGFRITTTQGKRAKNMSGRFYFKAPDKIRYAFSQPSGNLIVSDGRMLWIYIRRLNAVGKQDLQLKTKDENRRPVFRGTPGPGLSRLFRKYHYRFDVGEQPRVVDGVSVFVLNMEQREKIGGYERIQLEVDASTFLIRRAVATDGYSKKTTITFSKPALDKPMDGKLFQFSHKSAKVVNNPLVNE